MESCSNPFYKERERVGVLFYVTRDVASFSNLIGWLEFLQTSDVTRDVDSRAREHRA